jgi:hypothetical protein
MSIDPEILREILTYDPTTGMLHWRVRDPKFFAGKFRNAEHDAAAWNKKFALKEALTANKGNGYRVGSIFDTKVLAHRVAWAIYYGKWPDGHIDHANHRRDDNRIENLRDVSVQENCLNMTRCSDNTSGVVGVSRTTSGKPWSASIESGGMRKHLGTFDSFEDAAAARKAAESRMGFHKNHGEPAERRAA